MKPRLIHSYLCAASLLTVLILMIPSAQGANLVFTASLSGAAEEPPNASPGTGFSKVTYNSLAHTLRVEASFADLLGTTIAVHIHAPTAVPGAGNVGVATTVPSFPGFPLGVTAGSFDQTYDLTALGFYSPSFVTGFGGGTAAGAEAALIDALSTGRAYFNIHTTFASGGEIRGFYARSVPEPTMAFAVVLAMAGLLGLRKVNTRQTFR